MLLRLLFLLSLVALGYMTLRNWFGGQARQDKPLDQTSYPASAPALTRLPQRLAIAILSVMLAATGLFVFLDWQKNYQQVRVRVINTSSGAVQDYQARRGAIHDRRFDTLDGRQVILSPAERLEIGGGD